MVVKIKSPFCQGIESASSPGLYSLDVQYFTRTVFPRELGPGGTVFPKGIRSAGPKIGPDRIPYDTGHGLTGRSGCYGPGSACTCTKKFLLHAQSLACRYRCMFKLLLPRNLTFEQPAECIPIPASNILDHSLIKTAVKNLIYELTTCIVLCSMQRTTIGHGLLLSVS